MPASVPDSLGFWLPIVAPISDPAWADPRARRAYWEHAARFAEQTWKMHRARGLDRTGAQMKSISRLTAEDRQANRNSVTGKPPYSPMGKASPFNPPLQATGAKSRLQSLLRWEIRVDRAGREGVFFFWGVDRHTGLNWGIPLARHAGGFYKKFYRGAGYVPPRDVRGFSPAEVTLIEGEQARFWARERARYLPRQSRAARPIPGVPVGAGRGPVTGLLGRALQKLMGRVGLAGIGGG